MKFHHKYVFLLLFSVAFLLSCNKKTSPEPTEIAATLQDYTGFDGCSWVIVLENTEVKEPVNLNSFQLELVDGKKVWVNYSVLENAISICMVGEVVRIESIRNR